MKFFKFLPVFAILFVGVSDSWGANCQVFACGGNDSINASASGGGSQCYYCNDSYAGDKQCGNGAVIGQVDVNGRITHLKQCRTSWNNDEWKDFIPNVFCSNSDISVGAPSDKFANAYKTYSLDGGRKTVGYTSGDDTVLKAGNTACVYIKCNTGFAPNANKSACVEVGRGECESRTHMKWQGGKCLCKNGGTESADRSKCVTAAEAAAKKEQADKEKAAASAAARDRANANAAADKAKRKSACNAASGTSWSDSGKGTCACTEVNYSWNGKVCVLDARVSACNVIIAAGENAAWDINISQCICLDTGFSLVGQKCVESDDAKSARETAERLAAERAAAEAQAKADAAIALIKSNITRHHKGITDITSGFDVSRWKNAEGKFNTARLVSDSIAGVVLGTAGGLITSHVIKKNQIKSGFEDINCSVGGQVVAGWGDEFSVGIQ